MSAKRIILFPYGQPALQEQRTSCNRALLALGGDLQRVIDSPTSSLDAFVGHLDRMRSVFEHGDPPIIVFTRTHPLAGVVVEARRVMVQAQPQLANGEWVLAVDDGGDERFDGEATAIGQLDPYRGMERWTGPDETCYLVLRASAVTRMAPPLAVQRRHEPLYALQLGAQEIPVVTGSLTLGRAPECALMLDDEMVSRQHARMDFFPDRVLITDLASRNGVFVDGERISGAHVVVPGDTIRIGTADLKLVRCTSTSQRTETTTHPGLPLERRFDEAAGSEMTSPYSAVDLLANMVDKALAAGNAEQGQLLTERLLAPLVRKTKESLRPDAATLESAAHRAIKMAALAGKGRWIEEVFEMYKVWQRVMPAGLVDELYDAVRKVPPISARIVDEYTTALQTNAGNLTAGERFVLRRVAGLKAVILSR